MSLIWECIYDITQKQINKGNQQVLEQNKTKLLIK